MQQPIQQPIMLSGGNLPALNVYHNPVWVQGKPENNNNNQIQNYERLNFLNSQLDEELKKYNSMMGAKESANGNIAGPSSAGGYPQQAQSFMNNNMINQNQCNLLYYFIISLSYFIILFTFITLLYLMILFFLYLFYFYFL